MYGRVLVAGADMGIYAGEDEEEVLDNYARDAGYRSYEQLVKGAHGPGADWQVRVQDVEFVKGFPGDPHGEMARLEAPALDGGTYKVYEASEVPKSMRGEDEAFDHVIVQIRE